MSRGRKRGRFGLSFQAEFPAALFLSAFFFKLTDIKLLYYLAVLTVLSPVTILLRIPLTTRFPPSRNVKFPLILHRILVVLENS